VLAALFAGIAVASAAAARDQATLWIVTAAAGALALWLASLALRSLRTR